MSSLKLIKTNIFSNYTITSWIKRYQAFNLKPWLKMIVCNIFLTLIRDIYLDCFLIEINSVKVWNWLQMWHLLYDQNWNWLKDVTQGKGKNDIYEYIVFLRHCFGWFWLEVSTDMLQKSVHAYNSKHTTRPYRKWQCSFFKYVFNQWKVCIPAMDPASCCYWPLCIRVKEISVFLHGSSSSWCLVCVCLRTCVCVSVCVFPWYCIYTQAVYTTHTPHIDSVRPLILTSSVEASCGKNWWLILFPLYERLPHNFHTLA